MQVAPDGQERHVERHVSHGGIGLKDGDDGELHEDQEHGVFPKNTRVRGLKDG